MIAEAAGTSRATILRGIGRWDLLALMVNITLGSGILGLPARLFGLTDVYSVLVLLLCAAIIGVIALCFAEVGSRFVDSGGPYLFARTAFGAPTGFIVGWLYWISRVLTFATIANLLVSYAQRFVPAVPLATLRVFVITAVVAVITGIHLLGIRHATVAGNILTALKIAVLAGFGVFGLLSLGSAHNVVHVAVTGAPIPAMGDVSAAMLLALFAFVGFEAALVSAGETREPRRDVPFAIVGSLAIVLALYVGVQIVCIITVPSLAQSTTPFADAATVLWGPVGQHVAATGAIIIMLGSLNSGFLATTRLPFAFAEQGDLPAVLARVHPRFRTPHVAILSSGVLVLAATLGSTFLTAISLATSTRMIVYIAGCGSLIVLRRRTDAPPAAFTAPAGKTFAILAILLSAGLLASASGRELTQLAIAAASGAAVYLLMRRSGSAAQ